MSFLVSLLLFFNAQADLAVTSLFQVAQNDQMIEGDVEYQYDSTAPIDMFSTNPDDYAIEQRPEFNDFLIQDIDISYKGQRPLDVSSTKPEDYPLPPPKTLTYAKDLTECGAVGRRAAQGCGDCALAVRTSLQCLYKRMTGSSSIVRCGRGAYAYAQNNCLEKMGFIKVTGENCRIPGAILVYEGRKRQADGRMLKNNFANCDRYETGGVCGHIEFFGVDERYHAACNPQPEPRNLSAGTENSPGGARVLVACYHLKEWTNHNTWNPPWEDGI